MISDEEYILQLHTLHSMDRTSTYSCTIRLYFRNWKLEVLYERCAKLCVAKIWPLTQKWPKFDPLYKKRTKLDPLIQKIKNVVIKVKFWPHIQKTGQNLTLYTKIGQNLTPLYKKLPKCVPLYKKWPKFDPYTMIWDPLCNKMPYSRPPIHDFLHHIILISIQ